MIQATQRIFKICVGKLWIYTSTQHTFGVFRSSVEIYWPYLHHPRYFSLHIFTITNFKVTFGYEKTPKKLHQISPCKSFSTDYTMINRGVFWEFFEDEIGRHILHFINKDLHVNRNFWNLKLDFWVWKKLRKNSGWIFLKNTP